MDTLKIFKVLDKDVRLNYKSKAQFAEKLGVTRQRLNQIFYMLEANKKGNSFNLIADLLEKAGYEIKIIKKLWFFCLSFLRVQKFLWVFYLRQLIYYHYSHYHFLISIYRYNIMQIRIKVNNNIQKCRSEVREWRYQKFYLMK